ncbi:hypothetical protein IFR04_012409 [Cadophora malorum]|uniref:Uncharacterized protein n=1 Tax=Cadophora malorum TaxID=108018 RepID=A0A8H7W1J4_9HELO|nr:hypothetical protein IFR04_012409 [Cadophora malorum]
MEDYEYYYSSTSSSSSSNSSLSSTQCRSDIYNGKTIQISSCDNPNFTTTTIDGRCYNCGGTGKRELMELTRSNRNKPRPSEHGGSLYSSRGNSRRGLGYNHDHGYNTRERDEYEDRSRSKRNEIHMSSYDDRPSGNAYARQGAICCGSPDFFTTTCDGSCYNCGRFPDGRRSRIR